MLNSGGNAAADEVPPQSLSEAAPRKGGASAPLLRTAVRIVEATAEGCLLYVAEDDGRAATLAELVRALMPDHPVLFIPASDALPGDDAPASAANAGARVAALRQLAEATKDRLACITSAEATAQLYAPPQAFAATPPVVRVGDTIEPVAFAAQCADLGYVADERVDEPGEFAVRGAVIDVYPADAPLPFRIELEQGETPAGAQPIVAIRSYDPADQRSEDELASVTIGQAREPAGEAAVSLLAHCGDARVVEEPRVRARRDAFRALADDAARFGRRIARLVDESAWQAEVEARGRLDWNQDDAEAVTRFVERANPLAALVREVGPLLTEGGRLLVTGSRRDLRFLRPRLSRRLKRDPVEVGSWQEAAAIPLGGVAVLEAPADAGFRSPGLMVLAAADLLGSRAAGSGGAPLSEHLVLDGQAQLHVGDVVVHEDHGLCRLCGLETLPAPDGTPAGDAFVLEFADDARRLVPASEAARIWRYGGEADAVRLDKLDGSSWEKRRAELSVALAETARALVALAAERSASAMEPIEPDPAAYERFSSGFPFTETPDQARAIAAVRDDLAAGRRMDRLVIGDVGYGKTEVALRAAALVALAGGQVAVAAPTTVLVRQHLALFQQRFARSGIKVAGLSRLSTPAERREVAAGLNDGSIAVVVGTGAVAGRALRYANLKLVVIDEEQRFGAADKNKLRSLHDGHVLTLSATPIPRTLQAALVGLQQLSVIATPPARRQPIRTTLSQWDDALVRAALVRERARRGQSFVVVPRIEDMDDVAARLARTFPEGEVLRAHGKMNAGDLDTIMTDFAAGRGDVLLATNIIEAGLDVPRANTMIVCRADRFGLSQLHQLRGRVGRGNRRGQILLLTEADARIAAATTKRLRTLQAFDRLGAGFAISARDLDLRGAGDLVGDTQSGHMRLIGVDLYQHLLGLALRSARGEEVEDWQPELNLGGAGRLPESWLPEEDLRLQTYGRLARLDSQSDVDAFEAELADRFGDPPQDALMLLSEVRSRILARRVGVARVDAGPGAIAFTPRAGTSTRGWPAAGLEVSGERWLLREEHEDPGARAQRVAEVLEQLHS
ncbi:helicase-related protein [Qipengyuania thermophila]|uniref:helicase-related protein n=1 Tax=Qipengyuania thermophila TaxID=2509361 RepID=UPI001F316F47|nr:helicase-related protein [Qipengyuania thermophila]